MKYLKYFFAAAVIYTLLPLNSCTPSKPYEDDDVVILPAERLVKKLEVNRRKIKTFQGIGTIEVESGEFNNNAIFRVVLKKPDSINVTIFGPFGIELAQSLVTKSEFYFYDAFNNDLYYGEVSEEVLKAIFKVNLSFEELLDAFIGAVNLSDVLYDKPAEYKVDYDKYVLTYHDSVKSIKKTYHIDIKDLGINYYSISDLNGNPLVEAHYSDFEIVEDVAIPFEIRILNRVHDQVIELEYKRISANTSDIIINFRVPKDANVIRW